MKETAEVVRLAPPDATAWDDLVASSPEATVFHTSAWARLWTDQWSDATWEAWAVADGSGYVGALGAISRRRGLFQTLDSMPFATYGGPIVRKDRRDAAAIRRALLDAYARRARRRLTLRSQLAWYGATRADLPDSLPADETFTH
ncbi:MAG: hypothetical protein ACRENN_01110, partial [Candidatus Eiseniibacteriota bacterium]